MKDELIKTFGNGQYFTGYFMKKDKTLREFTGRIINHHKWSDNTIGLYDIKKKAYRAMRTDLTFMFKNKHHRLEQ